MAVTHSDFIKKLKVKSPKFFEEFEIIDSYVAAKIKITIKDKYGILKVTPDSLLTGNKPTILLAEDKASYFRNQIKILQPELFNNLSYIGDYVAAKIPIIVTTKYGDCTIIPMSLLYGKMPNISSAINPNLFFMHRAREIHGDKYDYSSVIYKKDNVDLDIICPKHGKFTQSPSNHLSGKGCAKCGYLSIRKPQKLDEGKFLEKAKLIHGGKYDYSKVKYEGTDSPVIIVCPIHGEIIQTPSNHLNSNGCKKCAYILGGLRGRLTTQNFLDRAKQVHGDLYDYTKTEYVKKAIPVTITCKIHGDFQQLSDSHIRGSHCPICSKIKGAEARKTDITEFIDKSNKIHNNKYSYEKTIYKGLEEKVIIICPEHGEFLQKPRDHYRNIGCPVCGKESFTAKRLIKVEDFIKKSKELNGDKFLYHNTKRIGNSKKVILTCRVHGDFEQDMFSHFGGSGCNKCGNEAIGDALRSNTDTFIESAKKIHGDTYLYEKTDYKSTHGKVLIICRKHGDFNQVAGTHLAGAGCRKCADALTSKRLQENPHGWKYTQWEEAGKKAKGFDGFKVYVVRLFNEFESFYKIGKTYNTIKERIYGDSNPYQYEVIKLFTGGARQMSELERELQNKNRSFRYIPKLHFNGKFECFSSVEDLNLTSLEPLSDLCTE